MSIPACNMEHEIWGPDPGCKEFMDEPDAIIACGQPAIGVVVIKEFSPPTTLSGPAEEEVAVIWYCLDCNPPNDATPYCEIIFPTHSNSNSN